VFSGAKRFGRGAEKEGHRAFDFRLKKYQGVFQGFGTTLAYRSESAGISGFWFYMSA
jgi:hypothetical protein